jgi:hypothetical protein
MGGKKWPTDFDLFKCSDAFARRSQVTEIFFKNRQTEI